MADDQNIEFTLTTKGVDETIYDFSRVQQAAAGIAQTTVKSAEESQAGFQTLGFAAAKLGENLGIPYRAAHVFGTRIEDIAKRTLPGWGIALGAAGVAATVAVGVISHLAESHKKQAEETIRSAHALEQEVSGMDKSWTSTKKLDDATYNLYLKKKLLAELQVEQAIRLEREQITKSVEEYNKLGGVTDSFLRGWGKSIEEFEKDVNQRRAMARANLEVDIVKLQQDIAYLDALKGRTATRDQVLYDPEKEDKKQLEDYREFGAEWLQAKIGLLKYQKSIEDAYQRNSAEGQRKTNMEMLDDWRETQKRRVQYEVETNKRQAELDKKRLEEEKKMEQLRRQMTLDTFSHFSNAAKMYWEEGHKGNRKAFTAYKLIEEARIVASTASAAMNAIDQGGPYIGWALAASIVAEGAMQLNKVRKLTPDSESSMDTAVGTYSAQASSGLPLITSTQQSTPTVINLNINGQRAGSYEVTEDVVKTLWENNGNVGGFSLNVVRSA